MERREFISLLGGAAAAWPLAARGQAAKVHRVAFVGAGPPVSRLVGGPLGRAFIEGLQALGYVEGKNLILEWRSAEGKYERYPEIIRQLVSINVDVIVTVGRPGTESAKEATKTVPIVMVGVIDPVARGLVQGFARPGGNVTGSTGDTGLENIDKRLQLLKELFPAISQIACLWLENQSPQELRQRVEASARALGLKVQFAEHSPTDYTGAFAFILRERPDALFVLQTESDFANRRLIVEFAANNRLPTMYPYREFVDVGGLISYGMASIDLFRRAAGYVDEILKGAKPADLPVQQPTTFELVINLNTAKALGMTVPSSLLARADEVIE
jgi:putative ABC transport system substrate-binding protein